MEPLLKPVDRSLAKPGRSTNSLTRTTAAPRRAGYRGLNHPHPNPLPEGEGVVALPHRVPSPLRREGSNNGAPFPRPHQREGSLGVFPRPLQGGEGCAGLAGAGARLSRSRVRGPRLRMDGYLTETCEDRREGQGLDGINPRPVSLCLAPYPVVTHINR